MAQRHEIEAWVNSDAWDDQDEAERVIDAIEASGSDDEGEWVRIAGGDQSDIDAADERTDDRLDATLAEPLAVYLATAQAADQARSDLEVILVRLHEQGMSKYRLARVTGLPDRTIGRMVNRRRA